MIAALVVIRFRPDADMDAVMDAQLSMRERIEEVPAFEFEHATSYVSADGVVALLVRLASPAGLAAWRADQEHRKVMELGWTEWLESYWGGEVLRRMHWDMHAGRTGYDESHPAPGEPVTIAFCFKLREGADAAAFQQEQFRMLQWLGENPAFEFRDVSAYEADNGEVLILVSFDSPAGLQAWANDPDHKAAMERGYTEWVEYGWTAELSMRIAWNRQNGRTVFPGGPA